MIDVQVVSREYNTLGAVKNGPRLWCLDWLEGMTGAERDFTGLKAHWSMWLDVSDQMRQQGTSAYAAGTGRRDTRFGIDAGSPAFILDDPDGASWVMKSVSLITHPEQTTKVSPALATSLISRPAGPFAQWCSTRTWCSPQTTAPRGSPRMISATCTTAPEDPSATTDHEPRPH
jgi:hypothetical protein